MPRIYLLHRNVLSRFIGLIVHDTLVEMLEHSFDRLDIEWDREWHPTRYHFIHGHLGRFNCLLLLINDFFYLSPYMLHLLVLSYVVKQLTISIQSRGALEKRLKNVWRSVLQTAILALE